MKTLAEILFLWQFSVFSSTSNIIFLFVKGRVIVYPRYLPLRAEVKITDIEDTLKWKQVEKSSFLKKKKATISENFTNMLVENYSNLLQKTNDDLTCWDIWLFKNLAGHLKDLNHTFKNSI